MNRDQQGQSQNQYQTEGMVEIEVDQVPATLRRTLGDAQYKGWEEKGTLYHNPTTNEYMLVMDNGQTSTSGDSESQTRGQSYRSGDQTQQQTYHFDRYGQLKEDKNESQKK